MKGEAGEAEQSRGVSSGEDTQVPARVSTVEWKKITFNNHSVTYRKVSVDMS